MLSEILELMKIYKKGCDIYLGTKCSLFIHCLCMKNLLNNGNLNLSKGLRKGTVEISHIYDYFSLIT